MRASDKQLVKEGDKIAIIWATRIRKQSRSNSRLIKYPQQIKDCCDLQCEVMR